MHLHQLLPWGSLPAAWLPRKLAEALADRCGTLASMGSTPAVRAARANLRQVLAVPADESQVRGVFQTYARYYLAMMRLAHRSTAAAVGTIEWRGVEALDETLARGKGALILSAHFGNWDLVGMALASRYGEIGAFVEPLPDRLFRFYSRIRRRHGVRPIPVGHRSRQPFEVLSRNGVLGLAADRVFGTRSERVPCGRGELAVPSGGIRLALRAGAGVHAVFAVRQVEGFNLRVSSDLAQTVDKTLETRVARVALAFAAELQAVVRSAPEQWCLLQPLQAAGWHRSDSRGAA